LKPREWSFLADGRNSTFSLNEPIESRMFFFGSVKAVARSALRYASYLSLPKHATSPVEAISTPRIGSALEGERAGV
jgi:hypothetical protein